MSGKPSAAVLHEIIARNFVRFREEAGLNLAEAASMANFAYGTLCRLELGQRGLPRVSTLAKFAELYGRPVEHFFLAEPPAADEEGSPSRPVFLLQIRSGSTPDPGLVQRLEEVLRTLNREHLELRREQLRLDREKGKTKKARGTAPTDGSGEGAGT